LKLIVFKNISLKLDNYDDVIKNQENINSKGSLKIISKLNEFHIQENLENQNIGDTLSKQPSVSIDFQLNKEEKSAVINRRKTSNQSQGYLNTNENCIRIK